MGGTPTEPMWLYGLAGALMLGGPIAREMYANHYPARPEAFVFPLLAGAVGAIVAVGSRRAGGILGTLAFGGLLFLFADLQLNTQRWVGTAVAILACLALAQVLARHRAALFSLTLGAFYLTSVVRPPVMPPPARLDTSEPSGSANTVLVHIVLDEQWGVGALRAAGDTATAEFLEDFYLTRGFDLYESAYSRYRETLDTFRSIMLLGEARPDSMPQPGAYHNSIYSNRYFARLRELGYAIRVYQTSYFDLCNGEVAVASCYVASGGSIANIGHLDGNWVRRGIWASRYFLSTRSHIFGRVIDEPVSWRRALAGGALAAGRNLATTIASHPAEGTAFFVHLLIPHRPFQADEECRLQKDPSRYLDYGLPPHPSDSLWRSVLGMYGDQVRCAHRMLATVIEAIDSTMGRDRSIVIVHGDHGSRLHPHEKHNDSLPLADNSAAELNSHFATLLAVRRPQGTATLHPEPTPVQDVIWQLARNGFVGPVPTEWPQYILQVPNRQYPGGQLRSLSSVDMPWVRRSN
jgi:hypothetical protein